jgi:hypothetical protein
MDIPASYYDYMLGRESGGNLNAKNPLSSALGPAQFLNGTWASLMQQHPELGLTPDGRTDPAQSNAGMRAFTQDNGNSLAKAGYDDPANLYLAHRFGAAGAVSLLKADPNAPASQVLTPQVLAANPDLRTKTVGQIIAGNRAPGGNMTPNARVNDGFMGLPASPNERVADAFDTLNGNPNERVASAFDALNAKQPGAPMNIVPPGAQPAMAGAGPTDLAAAKAAMPKGDPSWMGDTGNSLLNIGAALQSAYNPSGAAALTQIAQNSQAANKPEWGVIGEDLFGKKYGWINKNRQTVTSATGVGGSGDSSSLGADLTNFQNVVKSGETDKAKLLGALPDSVRGEVAGLIDGKASISALGRNNRTQFMALARMVDPNLDETTFKQRQEFAAGMGRTTPASYGGQVLSSGTIVKHTGDLFKYLPGVESGDLGNTDFMPSANGVKNWLRNEFGSDKEYQDAMGHIETARKGIAGEMERLLAGGHGAESSKAYWMERLDPKQGPTKVRAALDEVMNLMEGRLSTIAEAKDRAWGGSTDPYSLLSPKANETIKACAPAPTTADSLKLPQPHRLLQQQPRPARSGASTPLQERLSNNASTNRRSRPRRRRIS